MGTPTDADMYAAAKLLMDVSEPVSAPAPEARLPSPETFEGFYWVGVGRLGLSPEAQKLADNRDRVRFIGGVEDPNASYSFDETALVELDGVYYLCQTAGCSCPSPSEEWEVEKAGTIAEIRKTIEDGDYRGYTYGPSELAIMTDLINAEAWASQ